MTEIDAKTEVYCVIGDPIEHSFSPAMHNAAFKACGINAAYFAMHVKKEDLGGALHSLKALGIKGINVTMPHKAEVINYLDGLQGAAKEIGAVNTIANRGGKFIGYNTDVEGAISTIKSSGMKNLEGKHAIILSAGGAAKAVSFGLAKEGCKVTILARDAEKAKNEIKSLGEIGKKIDVGLLCRDNMLHLAATADLLCNCTPVGLNKGETPFPKEFLKKGLTVFDFVYASGGTRLIKDAVDSGCTAAGGEEILVNQGALSFELWTGKKPDKDIMLGVVREKLKMQEPARKNIFLAGFMGSGKTSVGKVLSEKLRMNFSDTDVEVEKMSGKKISEIFSEDGEEKFRQLEIDAIKLFCKKGNCIIATGGGAVTNYINIQRMKNCGTIVLLSAGLETLSKRIGSGSDRPLLSGLDAEERIKRIKEILKIREPFYSLAKDIEIDTDNKTVEKIADEIIRELGARR